MKLSMFNYSFVKNQSEEGTCDVFIDGDIVDADTQTWLAYWGIDTTTSYKSLRDQILNSGCNNINIHINSGGGMVSDALAMGDFIKEQITAGKNIKTYGKGIIASAATYPLMAAGKNSHISKNAFFMIHNVSGQVSGTVDEVEAGAKMMRKFNDCVRDEYADMTGKPKETIAAWMNAETWFTGKEACNNGFISNCTATANAFTNSIPKDKWPFQNTAILNTINNSITPPKNKEMKKLEKLGNAIKNVLTELGITAGSKLDQTQIDNLNTKITDAIEHSIGDEIENEVTTQVTNALKGDAYTAALTNSIKEILTAENNPINAAINTATTALVNKEELDALKNDLADKLGTPKKRTTNSTIENGESVADAEGWNR